MNTNSTIELRRITLRVLLVATVALSLPSFCSAAASAFPGTQSTWHGFTRFDFEVDGQPVVVVAPRQVAAGRPWIWHGEFFGHRPEPEIVLLGRGFHVVYMSIPNQFGSPKAVAHWNAFYKTLTSRHGLAKRAALVGISRGGLYCYNWAAQNPNKVACLYGDAPVCDVRSWPFGSGKGTGNKPEAKRILEVYGAKTEDELFEKALNPIDHLEPLAKANVPLLHVYGDADTGVPWDENTGILAERYRKLGGHITLIAKPGVGHVHGLDDSTPLIDFIARHAQPTSAEAATVVDIGSRRELFVDRYLIAKLKNARLHLHKPRDEGSVIRCDAQHEGPHSAYSTVIRDGDIYRMYYRGISELGLDGNDNERTCIAESRDGKTWVKPELGLFEFNGSKANNIVLADAAPATHNFCPMLDTKPGVPASERYKAVGGTGDKLFAFVSADGLHWKRMREEPVLSTDDVPFPHIHLFDSQNLVFWSESENTYVCYFRVWDGLRRIARSTSPDFRQWSPAVLMKQLHDDGISGVRAAPDEHLYTNQTSPYFRAPHIYVAMPARFFPNRQVLTESEANAIGVHPKFFKDTSDFAFMTSRGGDVYDRTFLQGYLKPAVGARNWVSRTNYPALNVVQTGPTEMSFYVNHDNAQPTVHIRRYSLRLDGFASVRTGAATGEVLTKPLIFSGDRLLINFATSAGGSVRCELQTLEGQPLAGFTLADCREQIGNEIDRIVTWNSGSDISKLVGQPVRLRFVMTDADLYAFQFRAAE